LSLTYPRDFNFNDEEFFEFELEVDKTKYFEIENFTGAIYTVLYDLTEGKRIIPTFSADQHKFKIEPTDNIKRKFVMINVAPENTHISGINLLEKKEFKNFSANENQGNYIIITHNKLRDGAVDQIERYKNYRESEEGGSYSVVVADIDDLYNQFSLGIEKHPMSIKNFINFAVDNWNIQPGFLNIIGKGVRYDQTRSNATEAYETCLVPSFGVTASDLMLTTKSTQDYFPQLAVGRIPAKTSEEVRAYLDKVFEYENWMSITKACENISDRAWMKNTISIAKGWGTQETGRIKDKLSIYNNNITNGFLGYNMVEEFQDAVGALSSSQENYFELNPGIKPRIEEGLAFINYMGHSAPKVSYWQFDMQHPSQYNNEGKYPFVLSNAPFVGKFNDFYDKTCMAEDYILADNGGAIGFLGLPALLMHDTMHIYANKFMENISYDNFGETIGEAMKATTVDIYDEDPINKVLSCEYSLTDDPAIKLYHWEQPEYLLVEDDLSLEPSGELNLSEVTKLDAKLYFQNWGQTNIDGMVDVVISQYDENENLVNQTTQTIESPKFDAWLEFEVPLPMDSPVGLNKFVFKVDGNDVYPEDCEENNMAERFVTIACEDLENNCEATGIFEIAGINIKVGPSPASSILNFYLNMEKEATLRIELLSIDGKLIDEVANDYYSAGQSVINYNLNDLNNGLYLYKISIGNDSKTGRVTIVK